MKNDRGSAVLYYCDPEKNTECRKMGCAHLFTRTEGGVCFITFQREFARTDGNGRPLIYKIKTRKTEDEKNV